MSPTHHSSSREAPHKCKFVCVCIDVCISMRPHKTSRFDFFKFKFMYKFLLLFHIAEIADHANKIHSESEYASESESESECYKVFNF